MGVGTTYIFEDMDFNFVSLPSCDFRLIRNKNKMTKVKQVRRRQAPTEIPTIIPIEREDDGESGSDKDSVGEKDTVVGMFMFDGSKEEGVVRDNPSEC